MSKFLYASIMQSTVVFNATLYQHIKNGGFTWQDYIKTIDTTARLETLEEFELGLEEVWERECSSDSDVDEVSIMNRRSHFSTGAVSSYLHKEFKLGLEEPSESDCSSDSDTTEQTRFH